jgi:hypothetical protein
MDQHGAAPMRPAPDTESDHAFSSAGRHFAIRRIDPAAWRHGRAAPRHPAPKVAPKTPQGARRPRCRHPGPAPPPPPAPKGRLEGAITPAFYRLDMTVDPAKERFFGHVEIDALLHGSSRYVYLHGRDLNVTKASVNVNGRKFAAHWKQVDDTGVALLSFDEEIPAGQATFAFDYDAAFQDGPQGMFRVKVGDQWYSWTQFESIDARAAFPSFDQPGYKQPFTVTLRTPKGMMAVSNAPEVETTDDGAMTVHRFEQTAPLPTYLVAMMVGNFAVAKGEVPATPQREKPLPLRIISTQQNKDKLSFALENSKSIIAHLETISAPLSLSETGPDHRAHHARRNGKCRGGFVSGQSADSG